MVYVKQSQRYFILITSMAVMLCLPIWSAQGAQQNELAQTILDKTGIKGGLVVHLNCNDGKLTSALRANDRYLVHGLDTNKHDVAQARKTIQSQDSYGKVSVDLLKGKRLPYIDNIVNLLIADDLGEVPMSEVMRVLTPNGVACIKKDDKWTKTIKPKPDTIDEWTHFLYDASNNAVSHDTKVEQPNHLQWLGEPKTSRSHDHMASISAVVTTAGRIFYIADEAPPAALAFPGEWYLSARDAFNGTLLWKKPVGPWEGHLRGFRTGPPELPRRLVAVDDRVYVTLGYGKPVTALDAATGDVIRTYKETDDTLEIIYNDGVLYLVTGQIDIAEVKQRRGESPAPRQKSMMAVDAESGKVLWDKASSDTDELLPVTLTVGDERVFFQNLDHIICLEAKTGDELWRTSRPVRTHRWAWSTPTLVVYEDVVISADRASNEPEKGQERLDKVEWIVSSRGGEAPKGEMIAYSAKTGVELWRSECREAYNAPPDVLVIDGLVWSGDLVGRRDPGITAARDVRTGEIKKERPNDQDFFSVGMGHHRCYRNKATEKYVFLGRSGVELLDVDTGDATANHWIRGTCQYGIMPGNGLLYVPPHPCACFIEAKLNGMISLSSKRQGWNGLLPNENKSKLEKGPAYGESTQASVDKNDWPTYRQNNTRSGSTDVDMPSKLEQGWEQTIGENLTSLVSANGLVFVASTDTHTVYALNEEDGSIEWSYTTGGRIDSPPTLYKGLALVGSANGYVYCLRASDGALVWRLQAAPDDQRMVVFGQLESVWPVPGSVLVMEETTDDGKRAVAYAVAGRSTYVDGGIYLYKFDPVSGEIIEQNRLDHRNPETKLPPQFDARGVNIPGALPDVLTSDGESIYMRNNRFDANLESLPPDVNHLFSPAGFLEDNWWHRTYWIYGTDMNSGWGGWPRTGNQSPAGRILAVDNNTVYGFGRMGQYATHGTHVGLPSELLPWPPRKENDPTHGTAHYELFSCQVRSQSVEDSAIEIRRGESDGKERVEMQWSTPTDLVVRAMVLADNALFVAGPPEYLTTGKGILDNQDIEAAKAAYQGKKGAILRAISTEDGNKIAEYQLDSPPVFDGMIAANNKWFVSTMDGKVLCLKGKK